MKFWLNDKFLQDFYDEILTSPNLVCIMKWEKIIYECGPLIVGLGPYKYMIKRNVSV